MSGGTLEHATLKNKLQTGGKKCRVLSNGIKAYIASAEAYVYPDPDAIIVCGGGVPSNQEGNAIINPTLVIAVLSKSTADYDRGDKFYQYRQLSSLQEYVLIDQEEAVVETFSEQADTDLWRIIRVEELDKPVEFCSLGISLNMAGIYKDTTLSGANLPRTTNRTT